MSKLKIPIDTKQKIIEVAIQLFSKHGIHWVSFQQIAEKVGISQPGVYKHFANKDDLLKHCITFAANSDRAYIDEQVSKKKTAKTKLHAYIATNLESAIVHNTHNSIFLSMYYFSLNNPEILKVFIEFNNKSVERILHQLEIGEQENFWKLDNKATTARNIHNLLTGEIIKTIINPKELSLAKRTENTWIAIEKLIMA